MMPRNNAHLRSRGTNEFAILQAKQNGPKTVYKTVYTTLPATFEGAVGGYSTKVEDNDTTTNAEGTRTKAEATTTKAATTKATTKATTTEAATTKATTNANEDSSLPDSIVASNTGEDGTTLALATSTPTTSATKAATTTTLTVSGTTAAAAASSTSTSSSSSGDSGAGAKAGIGIGIAAAVLIVALLAFFLFSRRRKQMEQQRVEDNEKLHEPFGGAIAASHLDRRASVHSTNTTRTTATAPRLSLRPVTQFLPNFSERRSSKGAAIALTVTPTNTHIPVIRNTPEGHWERPTTRQSNKNDNPFGSGAQRLDTPIDAQRSIVPDNEQISNPFDAPENVVGLAATTNSPPGTSHIAEAAIGAAGAGAVAGLVAVATLQRKQSIRKDIPQALDLTKQVALPSVPSQISPTGTEFSFTSVATGHSPGPSNSANAIAAAGGPISSTVHRVQLEFKPALEDEMGLRAGQLVRLLHEYDDGWALCIRLDRSQQGVVPRTCLSTRPVKPRPAGGPPGARNGPPVNTKGPPRGIPRGPNLPAGQRSVTPQGGPSHPRPESPMRPMNAGGRPQSPAGMRRPQSPAGMRRPQPPAGMRRPQSPAAMPRAQSPGPVRLNNSRFASPTPRSKIPVPRSQSPGPDRQRAPSQGTGNGRRMSQTGRSPMNPAGGKPAQTYRGPPQGPVGRKPVPGQAY